MTAFNSVGESPHSTNVTGATTGCTNAGYAKVGYYPQWGIYGRAFWLKNLDTSGNAARLTHLNYAFENISATTKQCFATTSPTSSNPQDPNQGDNAGDSTADYAWPVDAANSVDGVGDGGWGGAGPLKGNLNQLKKLKAKYPNLKIMVSLGGWTYSKYFSDAAATAAGRQALVNSCIDMYIKGNLPVHQGMGGPGTGANNLRRHRRRLGVAGGGRPPGQPLQRRRQGQPDPAAAGVPHPAQRLRHAGGQDVPAHRLRPGRPG